MKKHLLWLLRANATPIKTNRHKSPARCITATFRPESGVCVWLCNSIKQIKTFQCISKASLITRSRNHQLRNSIMTSISSEITSEGGGTPESATLTGRRRTATGRNFSGAELNNLRLKWGFFVGFFLKCDQRKPLSRGWWWWRRPQVISSVPELDARRKLHRKRPLSWWSTEPGAGGFCPCSELLLL